VVVGLGDNKEREGGFLGLRNHQLQFLLKLSREEAVLMAISRARSSKYTNQAFGDGSFMHGDVGRRGLPNHAGSGYT
jgi:hypothetical protein